MDKPKLVLLKLDLSEDVLLNKIESLEKDLQTAKDYSYLQKVIEIAADQLFFSEVEYHELGKCADHLQEALSWLKIFNEAMIKKD